MNRTPSLAIVAAILVALPGTLLSQVRSDFEIVRSFEIESGAIVTAIEAATTTIEIVDVESRIVELDSAYREYRAMIDRALYPDGFAGRLVKLRGQLAYAKDKITIIETQYVRITELETQVRKLSQQVENLAGENARMLGEMRLLKGSEAFDSLNAVIIKLRQGLRQRDDLIFALVDSLFLQYDKDVAVMSDREKRSVAARLERRNVFSGIQQSIKDNVQFLDATELTGNDIVKLGDEHAAFVSKWRGLGKKLADVYAGTASKRAAELATIDTMISRWKSKLGGLYWRTLNNVFVKAAIPVRPFSNGQEFYTILTAYLDEEIRKARDEKDGQRYFRYEAFADSLWHPHIVPDWIPSMVKTGGLTQQHVDTIQEKVDEWEAIVSPPLTAVYIVIGIVMLVVVLYLYRRYMRTREKVET
ncbi:MAG: hypothetical protein HY563_06990 [Ignavibacteriales bacterium]|nr:hypothetical protein [Ignavibacteriales bacterium]